MDKETSRLYSKTPVFRRRIKNAACIISEALRTIENPYLSCSFGKDSVVLLHLVLQQSPSIPIVFIDSGYCFPDTYEVRDAFVNKYNINLVELQQTHDYIEVIDQYGLPDDRTGAQQKKVVQILKKDPANRWAKDNNCKGHFWGLRKEESTGRRVLLNSKGALFYAKGAGLWRCAPLADWQWEDIWAYIHIYDLPYSKIYDKTGFCDPKQIRNTSWITTDGAAQNGRIVWLKFYYPDIFARLAQKFPSIKGYT